MPKSNDLLEFRGLDNMSLIKKIKLAKVELDSLLFDKNLNKLKDTSVIAKKKGVIAHLSTVLRQKELVSELEAKIDKKQPAKKIEEVVKESVKEVEEKTMTKKPAKTSKITKKKGAK